ncbi:hypothetical protein GCM10022221_72630 [Actinocorallia aurea]
MRGTFAMRTGSSVSSAATICLVIAFFAPETFTSPFNGMPPVIRYRRRSADMAAVPVLMGLLKMRVLSRKIRGGGRLSLTVRRTLYPHQTQKTADVFRAPPTSAASAPPCGCG